MSLPKKAGDVPNLYSSPLSSSPLSAPSSSETISAYFRKTLRKMAKLQSKSGKVCKMFARSAPYKNLRSVELLIVNPRHGNPTARNQALSTGFCTAARKTPKASTDWSPAPAVVLYEAHDFHELVLLAQLDLLGPELH